MMRRHSIALMLLMLGLTAGCASYDAASLGDESSGNAGPQEPRSSTADAYLYEHDIAGARDQYARLDTAQGTAGVAITNLLLLPYSEASTRVLTRHVGARNALDAQGDVIWGENGFVYFVARGVAWEDSPSTAGIKTLLVDRLPWSRQQIDSINGFVRGLNKPVALLAEDIPALADELAQIAADLESVIERSDFTTFFLPGEVFHDESLDLVLGKSELSLLRGAVKGFEAALHGFAAYEHAWTLERAFGEMIWSSVIGDETDPDHLPGAQTLDYQVAHVNESLGRAITSVDRLEAASDAASEALRALALGITLGVEELVDTTLNWRSADALVATQLTEFLTALADSFDGATDLPHTSPSQSANLSLLTEGRTIAEGENLLFVMTVDDGFGQTASVEIDEDVLANVLDGVFVPPFNANPAPELTISGDVERLIDGVSGAITEDFERSIGGGF